MTTAKEREGAISLAPSRSNGPNMLAAALRYAGGGVSVFPVNGKEPLTQHGFHDASRSREQVEAWWRRWPDAGIATSDFDVVDVDLYKAESGPTWKRIRPLIPEGTPQSETGGGGLQFFFQAGTLREGKIGPGVDNRYAGRGYAVLPPSAHPGGGRYRVVVDVLTHRPKPAPDFPLDASGGGTAAEIAKKLKTGEKITADRNQSTFWRAVKLLEQGTPLDQLEHVLQEWVHGNCDGNLDEINIAKQVRGAIKWVAQHNGQKNATQGTAPSTITWEWLSEVTMKSIVFADKPFLQRAAFHLSVGRKGAGKGTLNAGWVARVTRGELGPKTQVVWIASEDSNAIDVKPRVKAAGGVDGEILVVSEGWVQLPRDLALIDEKIAELGNVGMVIVDPVSNHMAGKNSDRDTDVRDVIAPLNQLADKRDVIVIGVRNLSEKECRGSVLAAILGGSAWVQVPRVVIAAVKDSEDPALTHVQVVGGNRLPPGTAAALVRIEGVLLPGLEEEVTRAVWLGASTKDVEAMLSTTTTGGQTSTASDQARDLLVEVLHKNGGQMESDQLDATVAEATGLKATTVRNLRGELRDKGWIRPAPEKDDTGAVVRWMVKLTNAAPAADPDHLARGGYAKDVIWTI